MIDPQVALDKLSGFSTTYEIADFLKEKGIKGYRTRHDRCPIATWMTETTGMTTSAAGYIVVLDARSNFFVNTPQILQDFMVKFDRGDFPELEK